jgi:hypothetical protein
MKQRPRIYYTESQKKLMWDKGGQLVIPCYQVAKPESP